MHRESGLRPILPDACTVIVDEAHKLPETAREMFGTTLTAGEIRGAVVRLKQAGYALASDRLFSASSTLLQKMAELSPEYPVEMLHDDLSRVLSTLFFDRQEAVHVSGTCHKAGAGAAHRQRSCCFFDPNRTPFVTPQRMMTASSCCAAFQQISHPECSAVWSKQIPLLLTSGTLAIGSSFRRFQDECGLSGNPRVTETVAVSPFTTPQIADCFSPIFRATRFF